MAIFHHSESVVSRSTGRSTVQAAAYLSGEKIKETRRQLIADFRNRADSVALWEQLAPEHAPDWCQTLQFWDILETFEDQWAKGYFRKSDALEKHCTSAQIGHSVVIALPKELSVKDHQHIVRDIAQKAFISKGHVVLFALHTDAGNPHVHFLISRRTITEAGELSSAKNRHLSTKSALLARRQLTAEVLNEMLERRGFEARVDHRSFADRGIEFIPTRHEGYAARKRLKEGKPTQIRADNERISQVNQTRAVQQPDLILHELTYHHATFSAQKAAHLIQKRVGDDPVLFAATYQVLMQRACAVGTGWGGELRYTSAIYQEQEARVLSGLAMCMQQTPDITFFKSYEDNTAIDETSDESGEQRGGWLRLLQPLKTLMASPHHAQTITNITLHTEQKAVVDRLCQDRALQVLVGRAGSGKTTVLRAVSARYTQAGASVVGMALSATAAGELGQAIQRPTDTVAFWLEKWTRLKATEQSLQNTSSTAEQRSLLVIQKALNAYQLTPRHTVIMDEAGMVGTRQWDHILQSVQQAGARLILVGDDHQFAPIEAGAVFREVVAQAKQSSCLHELTTIYRQKVDWMKTASYQLAQFNHYDALATYEQQGCVVPIYENGVQMIAGITVQRMIEHPDQTGIVMASTRAQCQQLNEAIKERLQQVDKVDKVIYHTPAGSLSVGDTIMFLENHRVYGIHNGQRGIVERIVPLDTQRDKEGDYQLTVRFLGSEASRLTLSTQEYTALGLGYAMTTHKSQGKTVDWAHFIVSSWTDAHSVYVGMTRHREHVRLFYDAHEFTDFKSLQKRLSRVASKDLVADYTIAPQHQTAWEAVQRYRVLGQDLAATVAEQDWATYNTLKAERVALGYKLLEKWSMHEAYSEQAGITREVIEIQCGIKVRPLSQVEQMARARVTDYREKAQTARALWYLIKQTHPGWMSRQHPEYKAWIALQTERNALARVIVDNKPLHHEFVTAEKGRGTSWRTLMRQSQQVVQGIARYDQRPVDVHERSQVIRLKYHDTATSVGLAYDSINLIQRLTDSVDEIAYGLLGSPFRHSATEWRYGRHGSLSIKVAGVQKGLWSNFETGQSGGVLQLIQAYAHCHSQREALQWGREWLGESREGRHQDKSRILSSASTVHNAQATGMVWKPLMPVPESATEPDIAHNRHLSRMLARQQQHEVARYAYRDEKGYLLGYTVRVENAQGHKSVLPLTYCHNGQGVAYWRWKGFEGLRPLYGLYELSTHPDKPVLIVEGEKTAEAARQLIDDHVVVSWLGGVSAIAKTNWQPLVGREVLLWPDHDVAGQRAMKGIAEQLVTMQHEQCITSRIRTVQVPDYFPEKWDLADALPKGVSHDIISSLIQAATVWYREHTILGFNEKTAQKVAEHYGLLVEDPKGCGDRSQQHYRVLIETYPIDEKDKAAIKTHMMLSEIVKPAVIQQYCATHAPLSRQLRSEAISGCVATVLQADKERTMTLSVALKEGHALYQSQLSQDRENLTSQQLDVSDTTLRLLVTQQRHYQHMTGHALPDRQHAIVLERAKQLEPLITQGHVESLAQAMVEKQTVRSIFDRDQYTTVMRVIEREFMALSTHQQSKIKAEQQVKQVAHEVGQWHQHLHHERQMMQNALRQTREVNRDKGEVER